MAETTSISIDLETAALVEEIKNITRLSKTEIARQAFAMFRNSLKGGQVVIVTTQPMQPEAQS